jgi:hypothetical protein
VGEMRDRLIDPETFDELIIVELIPSFRRP